MDTQKPDQKQSKGKTIFKEYSSWGKGQHFITVLQTTPDEKNKSVLIGRVYLEHTDKGWLYIAKGRDGVEIIRSNNIIDVKNHLKEVGPELARAEQEQAIAEPEKTEPQMQKQQTQPEQHAEPTPEQEIDEIRDRKSTKDKGITR